MGRCAARRILQNQKAEDHAGRRQHRGEAKTDPPAKGHNGPSQRAGTDQTAQRAQADHPCRQHAEAFGRIKTAENKQRAHQNRRATHPDQRHADQAIGQGLRHGHQTRPHDRNQHQAAQGAARAVAIEQKPHRELRQRKGCKPNGGNRPEISRIKAEITRQIECHDTQKNAEKLAHHISGQKGRKNQGDVPAGWMRSSGGRKQPEMAGSHAFFQA